MKNIIRKNSGVAVIFLLSIIPIFLWYKDIDSEINLRILSQAFALSGATLFAINFILSGRFKILENYFNGLNRIYIIHHLVGQIALIFLLFHPMLLGIYYLKISFESAFMVLFPKLIPGFATWLGIAALTLLIFLLILTLYIKLPYQIWRFTHKFLGLSLTLATLHIFFITSDVTVNLPLRFYILGMCLIGLACYTYRTLLFRILVKRYEYEVTGIEVVEDITQINLKPIAKPIPEPIPGQFIFASFKSLGITEEIHPFSLTSTPSENQISIAAKSSGDYTETLKLLKKGAVAKIEGPFGRFSYLESRRTKFIWIAGGIGATPFVSMANSLKSNNSYDIYFYYVVSEKKEAVFLAFFEQIARDIPNFNLIPVFTKSEGRITAEKITLKVPDFNSRDIFLCGPPPMMQSLRSQFNSFGMKNRHIFSEEFSLD